MQSVLRNDLCRFRICITVSAKMHTGVISTDITGQITGAFGSGSFCFRSDEPSSDCLFVVADLRTTAAVSTVFSKLVPFRTRLYDHSIFRCNLNDPFPKVHAVGFRYLSGFREILSDFGVQINKADHDRFCVSVQAFRNPPECMQMIL